MGLALWVGLDGDRASFDVAANRCAQFSLSIGYSKPSTLRFVMYVAEHESPLARYDYITFADTDDATYFDEDHPLFEGHVHELNPIGFNLIEVICYDPTARAGQEIKVLNAIHDNANAYPRAAFNCKIETDDDYAFAVALDADVATIFQTIMDNAVPELELLGACVVGEDPYTSDDFSDALDHKPQDKIVFQNTTLRAAIDQLLQLYPQFRLVFQPGVRKWRLIETTVSDDVTLTLNSYPLSGGLPSARWVMSKNLKGSMARRYSAVKFYGPPQLNQGDETVGGAGLTEGWDSGEEAFFTSLGPGGGGTGLAGQMWQVTNADHRLLGRTLKETVTVTAEVMVIGGQPIQAFTTYLPTLIVTWDSTKWYAVQGITFDRNAGKVYTPYPVYRKVIDDYVLPTDARLFFSYQTIPLTARYPEADFEGQILDDLGLEIEMRQYDECLAVGYERFTVVSDAARTAEFVKVAESIHSNCSSIGWTGGFTCLPSGAGRMDYEWLGLDRVVNFYAVDKDGNPTITGWEELNAIVTDVEYDFSNRITIVQFSSDLTEFGTEDPDTLKALLVSEALSNPAGIVISIYSPDLGYFSQSTLIQSTFQSGGIGGELGYPGANNASAGGLFNGPPAIGLSGDDE